MLHNKKLIAMLGGGQLGLMFVEKAQMMGEKVLVLDPDPDCPYGIRLPVTTDTCEMIEERWANWLAWDPVRMIDQPQAQQHLKSLKGLFIDCGSKDQYNLVYGARQLTRKLETLGIDHRYEEFPDNHSTVDYRMDISLPYLYKAIQ